MTRLITTLFAAFLMFGAFVPADAEARFGDVLRCDRDRLTSFWEQEIAGNALSGRGTVCATNSGLYSSMSVRGLTPGFAYTVWWVYIDRPASCAGVRLTPENSPVPFPEP